MPVQTVRRLSRVGTRVHVQDGGGRPHGDEVLATPASLADHDPGNVYVIGEGHSDIVTLRYALAPNPIMTPSAPATCSSIRLATSCIRLYGIHRLFHHGL